MHDTEDKKWWVDQYGEEYERYFVTNIATKLSIPVDINPQKQRDKYAPDLTIRNGQGLADLKCQCTPFFKTGQFYSMDPTYTVTFNKKDYERYKDNYPGIIVIFWVHWRVHNWTDRRGNRYTVRPVNGVWACKIMDIVTRVEKNMAPLHEYIRRKGDTSGNAKDSYLLNLLDMYWFGHA